MWVVTLGWWQLWSWLLTGRSPLLPPVQSELVPLVVCSGWWGRSAGHCCSSRFPLAFYVLLRVSYWKRRDP
jgi:hypothetical protein